MTGSARSGQIVVVGSTNLDLIAYTPRIPGPGETLVGDRFVMGFGGKGANQAVMASLLGAPVAMVNCVGDDAYGAMTRDNLASFGIDVTHVHVAPGASGVAPIWVEPDGTNRIIVIPGANDLLTPAQAEAAIAALPPPAVVIGQFEIPQTVTTAAFAAARRRGATTILNPAPGAAADPGLLAHTDWVIPNQVELGQLVPGTVDGDDAALVAARTVLGCGMVVTLGEAGAVLVEGDMVQRLPAPRVAAVDTTGAGDAFVGGFAYGLATGRDPITAVRLGILCASDSVTRPGTQTSFPRGAAVTPLLEAAAEPST
ncbi:MAG TPA: ribokinase [Acidimicrobiia bacterium]|nr:ribokinase [Acidimicrobiia bacterium]